MHPSEGPILSAKKKRKKTCQTGSIWPSRILLTFNDLSPFSIHHSRSQFVNYVTPANTFNSSLLPPWCKSDVNIWTADTWEFRRKMQAWATLLPNSTLCNCQRLLPNPVERYNKRNRVGWVSQLLLTREWVSVVSMTSQHRGRGNWAWLS